MQLLYTKRSPYARKVQVMALEKNIPLTLVEEDLMKKSPQLLAANPLGKIPALILEDGQSLFDSPVICDYLDSLNDTPTLIPAAQRFTILRWQALADGLMDSTVAMFLEKIRHPQDFNAKFLQNQEKNCALVLQYCEEHLAELADFTLASIAVACAVDYVNFRAPHLNAEGMYPKLQAWLAELTATRASMQETVPVN
jgi:glutathione S-transferase